MQISAEFPWQSAERIGVVKTLAGPNGSNMPMIVVVAELRDGDELHERSSRVRQFNFSKKCIEDALAVPPDRSVAGAFTQGLFVFYDGNGNFRLSLVYGKAEGTRLIWSAVKRQSFFVDVAAGNKTFRDRMSLDCASFDKLKEAFSVEKLTKEFYNRLFAWYQWALSEEMNVTYPNDTDRSEDDREINEHIIRLITRLMFVWFLKQKHLVPDNLFDPAKLKTILKKFNPTTGDNYYRAILQNLFFATLNSEIAERAFAADAGKISVNKEHFGIKTLYRYGAEFSGSEEDVLSLFSTIPFLNGGLFECLDKDKDYSDGFSRNLKQQARVPNRLFFDEQDGLIPLLQQYNFTVDENAPGDEDVALDPELLGKVFENLLGAYNPETKVAARNATGSFYTPREIVNYMVDESLIAHLIQKVSQTFLSADVRQAGMPSTPYLSHSPVSISQRRLPHWQAEQAVYWVTFRLGDSIPQEKLRQWKADRDAWKTHHPEPWTDEIWAEYDRQFTSRMDAWLDAGMGSRALARADVREAVKECLMKFDGARVLVHAAVIMPTHVHCLLQPIPHQDGDRLHVCNPPENGKMSLSELLKGIKGASARAANKILGLTGTFWMDESYDHIVRNERQYRFFEGYIQANPVKTGLKPSEYWLMVKRDEAREERAEQQTGMSATPFDASQQTGMPATPFDASQQTGMSATPFDASSIEKEVRKLFTDGERPEDRKLCEKIDNALVTAKILDPACGSGAFPMGILLRMVELLRILRNLPDDANVYDLKLQLIENCIYGGDIQCIAVQISKLRFFISLVCEQKPTENATENYGIHTLPNLETKFVAADSLIGLPSEGKDALNLFTGNIAQLKVELFEIRHKHFGAKTYREKKELRKQDKLKRDEIKKAVKQAAKPDKERLALLEKERAKVAEPKWKQMILPEEKQAVLFDGFETADSKSDELMYDANEKPRKDLDAAISRERHKVEIPTTVIDDIAEKLSSWDPYDQNKNATFSDPEWMFNVKDGFDIVIGNPPYVNVELVSPEKKMVYRKNYATFFKRYDLFGLFYEVALLRYTSKQGVVSFIVPQQIANNLSYSKLRNLMLDNAWLRDVLYLGDKVFEAANNDVCVLSLSKAGNETIRLVYALDFDNHQVTVVPSNYFKQYGNVISFGSDTGGEAVFQKMFSVKGWRLKDKFKVFQGIVTGNNTAFLPTPEQVIEAKIEQGLLKSVLLGRDFGKWVIRSTARQILYVDSETKIKKFPNTERWLSKFRDELTHGRSASERSTEWFCLHRPRVKAELDSTPKLLVQGTRNPRLVTRIVATLDDQGLYGTQGVNFIVPRSSSAPIHFLLAVLNSKLINYLYATKFLNVAVKAEYLKDTPVPDTSKIVQDKLSELAKMILAAKKADPAADTTKLEDEIDELVYDLYGLTPEEKEIVKASVSRGGAATVASDEEETKESEDAVASGSHKKTSKASAPTTKPNKKRKATLPASLPGWD